MVLSLDLDTQPISGDPPRLLAGKPGGQSFAPLLGPRLQLDQRPELVRRHRGKQGQESALQGPLSVTRNTPNAKIPPPAAGPARMPGPAAQSLPGRLPPAPAPPTSPTQPGQSAPSRDRAKPGTRRTRSGRLLACLLRVPGTGRGGRRRAHPYSTDNDRRRACQMSASCPSRS